MWSVAVAEDVDTALERVDACVSGVYGDDAHFRDPQTNNPVVIRYAYLRRIVTMHRQRVVEIIPATAGGDSGVPFLGRRG